MVFVDKDIDIGGITIEGLTEDSVSVKSECFLTIIHELCISKK